MLNMVYYRCQLIFILILDNLTSSLVLIVTAVHDDINVSVQK